MALGQPLNLAYDELKFTTHDYIIGGKMVVCYATIDGSYASLLNTDYDARQRVKFELATKMATYMVEQNLMEFTQMKDPLTFDTRLACRAYLAPNDQVKILRLANKIV